MTAMDAAQHIVKLGPIAVELVDRTMLGLAREIAMFQPTIDAVVRGDPEAILLVEFAEDDQDENLRRLMRLNELIGDLGLGWDKTRREMGRRGRGARSQAADRDHRDAHRRPQHHDVDEGGGQTGLLRRGLRGAARASRRIHLAAHRHLREARHPRHLVRACLGRLPACAAGAQPAAGQGRQGDARDRRGSLRDGARLQGLAFRRARRRHRALGIPREDVRAAARARVRGGQGALRSARPLQSRQDRARAEIRRPHACSATGRITTPTRSTTQLDWSAYPGAGGGFQGAVEMCNNNGACRALARRRDVPELPRHPRRARRHARARQHAAPRDHRPARARRARPRTRWRRR